MFPRIKELRIDKDILQKEICSDLKITQRNYSYIETGTTFLPVDILIKLAKYHKTSTDYILGLTDVSDPYPYSLSSSRRHRTK